MQGSRKPLVAIIGRPNVGKSTLFNRLTGRRDVIVSDVAGTTRDRVTTEAVWADRPLMLVDTGGLDIWTGDDLVQKVREQIEVAMAEADVIVLVVDVTAGVTPDDRDVGDAVRRSGKPVVLAANKADNEQRESAALEFYELGLGDPAPVSAYHNLGIEDLMASVVERLPSQPGVPEPEVDLRLAIVGRTNVGKSMLVNAITQRERAIVSEMPGTTRDALDTLVSYRGKAVLLVDTAGIRRSGRVKPGIERYSVLRAIRAIDRSEVVALVMDASELTSSQDAHIASYILDAYKGIVLTVNKWDLAHEAGLTQKEAARRIRERLRFAHYAPICFTSALHRSGLSQLLDTAQMVRQEWQKGLPRYGLRRTVMSAVAEHPPPTSGRHSVKIYGVVQDRTRPPTFTFYVNRSDMVHFSYRRYLENALRAAYEFKGSPIRMRFKGRGEK